MGISNFEEKNFVKFSGNFLKNHKKLHISKTIYLKLLWSYSEVNQIIWSTEPVCEKFQDFKQAILAVKIFTFSKLLHRRNWFPSLFFHASCLSFNKLRKISLREVWVIQASCLSFEVLESISSFHRLFHFIEFFKQAIWALKFCSGSILFMVWIGFGKIEFFKQATWALKFWNWSIFFMVWIGFGKIEFFKQASWALKFWNWSILFIVESVFWNFEFIKQAIWVLKFWSWSIHVIVWIGLWKFEFFKQAIWALKFRS